ncbi:uncharacterized protein [Anoplolepis gracilipes]|uniref:uncharacterized protein n=1 Tax=Anoplolepis gracilipes TaxID=354296 RepID=UPI003BA233DE
MIVLGWIKSSRKFNTFIANRIREIQELTSIESWHHVRTHDNPADILSRGSDPETLKKSDIWWRGPQWLSENEASWHTMIQPDMNPEELPEQRKTIVSAAAIKSFDIIERFSSYIRLIRTIAMCLRFVHNIRVSKEHRKLGPISSQEFTASKKIIVKRVQQEAFLREIENIRNQRVTTRENRLLRLNPFIDSEGLLRVGGRLRNADLAYAAKHQLIIPAGHKFIKLVIEHEHKRITQDLNLH